MEIINEKIQELAEKAGAFPVGSGADNSFGFRERALERFVKMIANECVSICNERAESAEFSYTPAKALVARRTATGCATIIKNIFEIE